LSQERFTILKIICKGIGEKAAESSGSSREERRSYTAAVKLVLCAWTVFKYLFFHSQTAHKIQRLRADVLSLRGLCI
jgi:hypothetical protein